MSAGLTVERLSVDYGAAPGLADRLRRRDGTRVRAVDDVSLEIPAGSTLGLVGESGCGKSTLARAVVGLVAPSGGRILLDGAELGRRRSLGTRRRVQLVFQDPTASLNPALSVGRMLRELLVVHEVVPRGEVEARCRTLLELVELPATVLTARPRQLSGGQRQRVAIARALALEPELLIADEAVAALDVSVQAAVLALLRRLQRELSLTLLFISHDIAVVEQLCERVAVMYLGAIVEEGAAAAVLRAPRHPYTAALLDAVPSLGVRSDAAWEPIGEPPSPMAVPTGCRFHPRCALGRPEPCTSVSPPLAGAQQQRAACHFSDEVAATGPRVQTPG